MASCWPFLKIKSKYDVYEAVEQLENHRIQLLRYLRGQEILLKTIKSRQERYPHLATLLTAKYIRIQTRVNQLEVDADNIEKLQIGIGQNVTNAAAIDAVRCSNIVLRQYNESIFSSLAHLDDLDDFLLQTQNTSFTNVTLDSTKYQNLAPIVAFPLCPTRALPTPPHPKISTPIISNV